MEGFMLTVAQHRRSFQYKKKQEWRDLFVKLDDISARLIALTDRSQFEVCWSVYLVGADISTPVPGESSNGIDVDDTPYCFYVRETSAAKDCTHYFSTPTGSTKKAWVKALTQVARDGPRAPRFAASQPGNEFNFQARVVKSRPHVDGTHAEYLITCSCQVFSKLIARRVMKAWSLWRRFSEFDELHQALKKSMGPQLEGIDLVKHKRDAFKGVLGKAFDHNFLEKRHILLDSYLTKCLQGSACCRLFQTPLRPEPQGDV
ncbi:hypothetical protein PC129_g1741 [Phytophthora cactorum]|uniref:PX domain-containing protein n=1 Tax=Phytophthora cactorum TaxID=29920 RepID=A0A329RYM5_9STRA|nr:hypothetical protein PC129_g1741 [Phytophthora cactorum]RAW28522.1 hypothetical protein PC110_g15099 [Phytophthora cactorum]